MSDSHFDPDPETDPELDSVDDASSSTGLPIARPAPLTKRQRLLQVWRSASSLKPRGALRLSRIRWPRLLFASMVVAVASLGGILFLLNSGLFHITSVDVEGTEVVSPASVRQLSGLKGQHVILADLEAAAERIAALPMVKEVTIRRDWPNGIKVVIVERTPWGRWRANNTVWAIDSEGVVLEGPAPTTHGPIVNQISAMPAIAAGARVDLTAVEMVHQLDRRGAPLPLPAVIAYEWSLSDGLVVLTEHGRVVFGGADGFDFKYRVWHLLEHEAQARNEPLLFADLRFGLRPRVEIGFNLGRGIRNPTETTSIPVSATPGQPQLSQPSVPSESSQQ